MELLEILLITVVPVYIGSVIDGLSRKFLNVYGRRCSMWFAAVFRSLKCNLKPEQRALTWRSLQNTVKIKTESRHESVIFCSEFQTENVFMNNFNGLQSNDICFLVKLRNEHRKM